MWILIITIIVVIIFIGKSNLKRPANFPDGPTVYPFIGNLLNFNTKYASEEAIRLHKIYGDFSVIFPYFKIIVIKNVNLITELFSSTKFSGRPNIAFNRDRFNGKNLGIVMSDGDVWELNKKFAIFHMKNLGAGASKQESVVHDEIYEIMDYIDHNVGKPFNIKERFYFLNINITWTLLGGSRFKHGDQKILLIAKALDVIGHYFTIFGGPATIFPLLRKVMPSLTGYTNFLHQHTVLSNLCKDVIDNHVKTRMPNNPRDLVDYYLDEINSKKLSPDIFNIEVLTSVYVDSLIGGAATGSTTVSWAVMMLTLYPEKEKKLKEELHRVLGYDRLPTINDLPNLIYARAVFNEIMRYRPSSSLVLAHRATEDTTLGKYVIPKDTLIFPSTETAFLDEKVWKNPDRFEPERFINADGTFKKVDAFFPFGRGKRVCPGERQARMANVIVLASMFQKYTFAFPEEDGPPNTNLIRRFISDCPPYRILATPIINPTNS